jgi:transcriptional regulator with XRE-family HTH domain
MELYIADTLKSLRANRGNTQEDLANHLCVSIQAVSKWERGEGLPDITMLPGIAAYYDVTVDTLLGCDRLKKEEELRTFQIEIHKLAHQGKPEKMLTLCREMQKKYPNEEAVLYELMYALFGINRKENATESISIAEKLLNSKEASYRNGAIQVLCYAHDAIGQKEQALKYAEMVPVHADYLRYILEGEERVKHCQEYFWELCSEISVTLDLLLYCEAAGYTAEERHEGQRFLYDLYHMIFKNGDFGFWEDRLGRLCYAMAKDSMAEGNHDRALSELEEMFEHFEKYSHFVNIDHTSLLVNRIHYAEYKVGYSTQKTNFAIFLDSLAKNKIFDPLREHPRFLALTEKMKEKTTI